MKLPGSDGPVGSDIAKNKEIAKRIGYPIIIKASGGGGGRGMRVVRSEDALEESIAMTKAEAKKQHLIMTWFIWKIFRKSTPC